MVFKHLCAVIALLGTFSSAFGQSKMIYGPRHLIFADIPKNWVQMPIEQAPFFIKPDEKDVDNKTYMYILGIDYSINPDLNEWIKANSDELATNFEGLKMDSLALIFDNLKQEGYTTGRYKIVTYVYPDKRNEALLIVECTNSIISIVMSAADSKVFEKNLPAFKELVASIKIMAATVKIKD